MEEYNRMRSQAILKVITQPTNQIALCLACPCKPGFTFVNTASLRAHKRSKGHLAYETRLERKDACMRSKANENEVERITRTLADANENIGHLLQEKRVLETRLAEALAELSVVRDALEATTDAMISKAADLIACQKELHVANKHLSVIGKVLKKKA